MSLHLFHSIYSILHVFHMMIDCVVIPACADCSPKVSVWVLGFVGKMIPTHRIGIGSIHFGDHSQLRTQFGVKGCSVCFNFVISSLRGMRVASISCVGGGVHINHHQLAFLAHTPSQGRLHEQ